MQYSVKTLCYLIFNIFYSLQGSKTFIPFLFFPYHLFLWPSVLSIYFTVWSTAHLRCLYKNTHSIGNKQEEQKATVQRSNLWSDCYSWNMVGWITQLGCLSATGELLLQWYPPCTEDNFLFEVVGGPTRGWMLLDQLIANTAELIRVMSMDYSDHTLMEVTMMRRVRTLILGE